MFRVWLLFFALLPHAARSGVFNRISTYPVCQQIDATCDDNTKTSANAIAVTSDKKTLLYTDSPRNAVGFVDISDPANPTGIGSAEFDGEPTAVAVKDDFVLVSVARKSKKKKNSGRLYIFDASNMAGISDSDDATETIKLDGKPNSIALSPDGEYAAVTIENEDDSSGFLVVLDTSSGDPSKWTQKEVSLEGGEECRFDKNVFPEHVHISKKNRAIVSLQDNNCLAIVNLKKKKFLRSFSVRQGLLPNADTMKDGIIALDETAQLRREPDGVIWLSNKVVATADEGSRDGGSRGFTIFQASGNIIFTSGSALDLRASKMGHYPENRSSERGIEPEGLAYGQFGDEKFLFVISKRANLVYVNEVSDRKNPTLKQALPTGLTPKSAVAIPEDGLLIVAAVTDNRERGIRSSLSFFKYEEALAMYPTLVSKDREDGTPIPWGSLSGLAAGISRRAKNTLFAVEGNFYKKNRIFRISIEQKPAIITQEIRILDSQDVLLAALIGPSDTTTTTPTTLDPGIGTSDPGTTAPPTSSKPGIGTSDPGGANPPTTSVPGIGTSDPGAPDPPATSGPGIGTSDPGGADPPTTSDPGIGIPVFGDSKFGASERISESSEMPALAFDGLINSDKTVNLNLEGIAQIKGGFWVVSESRGAVGQPENPVTSLNYLIRVAFDGVITEVVTLPEDAKALQNDFGFAGVAVNDGKSPDYIVVIFRRELEGEAGARIGIYNTTDEMWKFVLYPLDAIESQNGGWVGLSDIAPLGGKEFLVLERDNQAGPDAAIKRVYKIELDFESLSDLEIIEKELECDLITDLSKPNGLMYEKVDGLAVTYDGDIWVVNDNDGVENNSGETQLVEACALPDIGPS